MGFKEVNKQVFPGTFAYENNQKVSRCFQLEQNIQSTERLNCFLWKKKKVYCILEVNRYLFTKKVRIKDLTFVKAHMKHFTATRGQ